MIPPRNEQKQEVTSVAGLQVLLRKHEDALREADRRASDLDTQIESLSRQRMTAEQRAFEATVRRKAIRAAIRVMEDEGLV